MTGGHFGERKKPALTVFDLLLSSTFESSLGWLCPLEALLLSMEMSAVVNIERKQSITEP